MSRFIVLVLDGFGVGAMEDAADYRIADAHANTCLHVLEKNPDLYLPQMEALGLMNIIGDEMNHMSFCNRATYGKAKLKHYGADTFYGHQEIMGTDPIRTHLYSFASIYDKVASALIHNGYSVKEYSLSNGGKAMGINDIAIATDNQANDPGQVYNVVGIGDVISFDEILKISRIIRNEVEITRVIAHCCHNISYQQVEESIVETLPGYAGLDLTRYPHFFENIQIRHLGYGVDETVQTPYILGKYDVPVTHIGKFADLVANPKGVNISCVDTNLVLSHLKKTIEEQKEGLIAANVQETDLSGHEQNPVKYGDKLKLVDNALKDILEMLKDDDIMIIMADHGNDPTNGSIYHSREHVPLMISGKKTKKVDIGLRDTMSDVGATILDYFSRDPKYLNTGLRHEKTGNGTSFLDLIMQ